MDNNPFSTDWMTGWTEMQRKMWEDWSEVTQNSWAKNLQTENPMNFFRESMNRWPGMFGNTPTPENIAMNQAMSSMDGFMRMAQEVFKVFQNLSQNDHSGQEWTSQLNQIIQNAKDFFSKSGNSFFPNMNSMGNMGNMGMGTMGMGTMGMGTMGMGNTGHMEDLSAFWSRPMKAWSDFLSNNPMFSNDMMRSMLSGNQSMDDIMSRFLSAPGLGYGREKQEKMQEGLQLGLEFRKAMEEFQMFTNKSNTRSLDLLHRKLLELGAEGKPLQSMRDLYVLWVDCSEEANVELVTSKEYNTLNSRMTNALMRVRRHVGDTVDSALETMNMPTRHELNSAHKQISVLKRRVQTLEDEIQTLKGKDSSSDINALRDDMEKLGVRRLREDLTSLKKQLEESLLAAPVESSSTDQPSPVIKKTIRPVGTKPPVATRPVQKGA